MPNKDGSLNLFDILNSINEKKPIEYNKKTASTYLLLLWLSHDRSLIKLCNQLNKYLFKLNDKQMYSMMYHTVPKKKRFIKWIKKEKLSNKKEKQVEQLMKKYDISRREAELTIL